MRLLLDTHAFLWFVTGDRRLSRTARRHLEDRRSERFLSVASIWEMAIKLSLGRLQLDVPLADVVAEGAIENGISVMLVRPEHAIGLSVLPLHHRDPFDRMLVAQAIEERCTLITKDRAIHAYPVEHLW